MFNRIRPGILLIAALLTMAGCGGKREDLVAVEGTVKLDGQPLPNVQVQFIPHSDKPGAKRSTAITDESGHYKLIRDDNRPGVETGLFSVTLIDATPAGGQSNVTPSSKRDEKPRARVPSRLPPKYMRATTTPFNAIEVTPDKHDIPLELKANP